MSRVKKHWVWVGRESLYWQVERVYIVVRGLDVRGAVRAGSASRVESLVGRPYRQLVVGSAGGDISAAG